MSAAGWAGVGAFLIGVGSVLSGWAAIKTAYRRGQEDEDDE